MEKGIVSILSNRKTKSVVEKIASYIFTACAIVSIVAVASITIYMFISGTPAIFKVGLTEILFSNVWTPTAQIPQYGILNIILTSIVGVFLAICIGVPIGILTAVNLSEIANPRVRNIVKSAVELLAGIPSVVYGFFGLVEMVPFIREHIGGTGSSMLTASLLLGMMILPTLISVAEAALRAVPDSYYEGALALGAGHVRSVFFTVVPAAKSGIMAAIILGMGRAVGETMAVIMVAGNQARMPIGILEGVRTMTTNIVIEMGYAADLHRDALIATAVVLFVFILIINLTFSYLKGKVVQQ